MRRPFWFRGSVWWYDLLSPEGRRKIIALEYDLVEIEVHLHYARRLSLAQ
ncbi:MAG: hypothetical protein ACI80M_000287 [Gammaproteobacteria bacterium]|jgi:hypothetical protein